MLKSGALFLLALLGMAPGPLAAQETIVAHWSTNVTFARGQNGRSVTFVCPPGQPSNAWGTKVYTDDSSVCTAALHGGAIDRRGGAITVTIQPGLSKYAGSASNGVETNDYGAHEGSFTVSKATADGQVDWTTTAKGLATSSIKELTVICPPGGSAAPVWGTEIYTDDSSICAAAVHAGIITFANGGKVTLKPGGARRTFRGSVQRGVTSAEFGAYESSFELAGAKPESSKVMADSRVGKPPAGSRRTDTPPDSVPAQPPSNSNPPAAAAGVMRSFTVDPLKIIGKTDVALRVMSTPPLNVTGNHAQPKLVIFTTAPLKLTGTAP